jgi:hypothetical protein
MCDICIVGSCCSVAKIKAAVKSGCVEAEQIHETEAHA